ncbi:phosphate ABC transporter substrate-binding protein [Spiroplasma corruscae]|uniref:Phosphate ABC transporter substrate-binding protein n=1 Tax=Spiroplasma corruscae TaxID=216934 RepID=A0A222EN84_9MOLU|nr:phosphate ABC transporter substrate-binding protein [Spiroplasma corruscae]ASP27965.1 phosphate ABC transporter substrate-binding protein [Spiroplasma corruscae]
MSKKISIFLISFLLIMLSFWIWTIATTKDSIVIGGSTSVNPFMQLATKSYSKNDFVYNSTGSQAGVSGVEKGMYEAGFISKDAVDGEGKSQTLSSGNSFIKDGYWEVNKDGSFTDYKKQLKEYSNSSKSNSFLSITIAIDAIGIIFNSPSYWSKQVNGTSINDLVNFNINEKDDLLALLYEGNITWYDLASKFLAKLNKSNLDLLKTWNEDNKDAGNNKVPTFTREDGSGTRSAFSDLTKIKKMPNSNVVNSNGAMIEQIRSSTGFGYVSNGFIQNLSKDSGIYLAGIEWQKLASPLTEGNNPFKFSDESLSWEKSDTYNSNNEFIINSYSFKRPFICIANIKSKHFEELYNFIEFLYLWNEDDKENPFNIEGLVKSIIFNELHKQVGNQE